VVAAVDESVDATRCGGRGDCQDGKRCLTHELWAELSEQIRTFLSEISLGDLVEQGHSQSAEETPGRTDVAVALRGRPVSRTTDAM
jgi:Rrf2 family iron-sulfur cluster assembly transcriptional regulator